jgi:Predicted membrane protein
MLIAFPLGLLPASVVADLVRILTGGDLWGIFSFWLIVAGIASGLLAGTVGFIDWIHLPPGTKARRVGAAHALANLCMLILFALSAGLRLGEPGNPSPIAIGCSILALFFGFVGGWLGGELVFRLQTGVHESASPRVGEVSR